MSEPKPVLIIGMHRSGTSCLAGSLQSCGLYLGEVNNQAGFNKKGNKEHQALVALHERILARIGSSWDHPPHDTVNWTDQERRDLQDILARLQDNAVSTRFGVKDPRTLILFDGWAELDTHLVGTFRHPGAVSQSLCNRAKAWGQDMSPYQAKNLWLIYNEHLLELYRRRPFPIIDYDQAVDTYNQQVFEIARALEIPNPAFPTFRTEELTHFAGRERPDGDIGTIYDRLVAASTGQ